MYFEKLASAILNDVLSGLRGYHNNLSMSMELLEDEIVNERLAIIKEYSLKGILPTDDLYLEINCIDVDCKDIEKCNCKESIDNTPTAHFEIPLIISSDNAVAYIGSTDKLNPFLTYTTITSLRTRKYRKRGANKPFVWIDTTPNENGMFDCFVFNAPYLKQVSVIAVFKDPRLLINYLCCSDYMDDNFSFISNEILKRLTEKKLRYYRQFAAPILPNDQKYNAG